MDSAGFDWILRILEQDADRPLGFLHGEVATNCISPSLTLPKREVQELRQRQEPE